MCERQSHQCFIFIVFSFGTSESEMISDESNVDDGYNDNFQPDKFQKFQIIKTM